MEIGRSQTGNSRGTLRWIGLFSKECIRELLTPWTKVLKRVQDYEIKLGCPLGFLNGREGTPPAVTLTALQASGFCPGGKGER